MAKSKQGRRTGARPQGGGQRPANHTGSAAVSASQRTANLADEEVRTSAPPVGEASAQTIIGQDANEAPPQDTSPTSTHPVEATAHALSAAPGVADTNGATAQPPSAPRDVTPPNATSPKVTPKVTPPKATPKATSAKGSSAPGRPVVSSARQRTGGARPANRQRYVARVPWWRRNLGLLITVGVVVVVIASFIGIAIGNSNQSGSARAAASQQVFQQVTSVPASVFDQVGTGGLKNPIIGLPTAPLLTQNGKPEVLYVGAEFCPYCAAERWSMVAALSRFGTWKNLNTTTSSSTDVFPNTHTFTFTESGYTSDALAFVPKEIQDRQGNTLQTLTPEEQAIFSKYDTPPFVSQQLANGIPFTSFGNQYMATSSGYSPQLLQGLSWEQIAGKLSNPNDPVTKGIIGNANYITAAICKINHNTPGSVCNSQTIQRIASQLPKG